jgi:hypothetical protein
MRRLSAELLTGPRTLGLTLCAVRDLAVLNMYFEKTFIVLLCLLWAVGLVFNVVMFQGL